MRAIILDGGTNDVITAINRITSNGDSKTTRPKPTSVAAKPPVPELPFEPALLRTVKVKKSKSKPGPRDHHWLGMDYEWCTQVEATRFRTFTKSRNTIDILNTLGNSTKGMSSIELGQRLNLPTATANSRCKSMINAFTMCQKKYSADTRKPHRIISYNKDVQRWFVSPGVSLKVR